MAQKTTKAITKRFQMTKTGKVLKRHAGQDHFNSRDTGKMSRRKRRDKTAPAAIHRLVKAN